MKTADLKIAILVASYNRKQKTIGFLKSLITQQHFSELQTDIYLLDDASTDGTADLVSSTYPFIKILKGDGNLFWAGGMRKVWNYAISQKKYDLFFLFNDDVVLFDYAFEKLISNYAKINQPGVVLIGSTISPSSNKISYGGFRLNNIKYSKYNFVLPDEQSLTGCHMANANILLVDCHTIEKIGVFDALYTHSLADFDYTLSAYRAGLSVLVAPGYYGYCEDDHGVNWLSASHSFQDRLKYLYSNKGLAYKEYLYYIKKHFPADYLNTFIKLWLKTLFPIIWDKFKKTEYQ
jgi:GT2 family glycosyltransferase